MSSKLIKINGGGRTYKRENYANFINITNSDTGKVDRAMHITTEEIHLIKTLNNIIDGSNINAYTYYNEKEKLKAISKLYRRLALQNERIVLQELLKSAIIGRNGYIVTNFIEGTTLFDLATTSYFRDSGINERRLKYIFKPILTFINIINSAGYYHNDIKLDNIMVTPDYKVCIIDYGLMSKGSDSGIFGCLPDYCDTNNYRKLILDILRETRAIPEEKEKEKALIDRWLNNKHREMLYDAERCIEETRIAIGIRDSNRDLFALAACIIYIINGTFDFDVTDGVSTLLLDKLTRITDISDELRDFLEKLLTDKLNHTNVLSHNWFVDVEEVEDEEGVTHRVGLSDPSGGNIKKRKKKKSKKVKSKKLRSKKKKSKRRNNSRKRKKHKRTIKK